MSMKKNMENYNLSEIKIRTHLIITDIHEEYHINWCGKLFDAKPALNEKWYANLRNYWKSKANGTQHY